MPYFVATYAYSSDVALRDAVRPDHRAWLTALGDMLVLAGPTDADGGVLVLEAADAAEVTRTLDDDPFVTSGVVVGRSVVGWTPVLGRAAGALAARP